MDRHLAGASSVLAKGSGHFWGQDGEEETVTIRRKSKLRKVVPKLTKTLETPVKTVKIKNQVGDDKSIAMTGKNDDHKLP